VTPHSLIFFGPRSNEISHPIRAHTLPNASAIQVGWYSSQRLHSALGYRSPADVHQQWMGRPGTLAEAAKEKQEKEPLQNPELDS